MTPRVLVTGATGFIGARAVAALVSRGAEVHALVIEPDAQIPGAQTYVVDLFEEKTVGAVLDRIRPAQLLHLAWYVEHGKFWTSPQNLVWAARTGTLVRQFAAAGGRRVVGVGTCAEYGEAEGTCVESATPIAPTTIYGQAKAAAWFFMQATPRLVHRYQGAAMKLPAIIRADWPRKLAALLFAMLIWYSVSVQLQETTTITVPVTLKLPPGMTVLTQLQPRVSLHLRGSRRSFDNLTPKDIVIAPVIPEDAPTGPYQVRLKISEVVITGSAAQIMSIEPDNFTVTLDTIMTKNDVPVRPIFAGNPPDGWRRKNLFISPPRVTLTGPSSVVNDIQEVTTHNILLSNTIRDEELEVSVPISAYPQVTMNYERVNVKVEFARAEDDAQISQLPISVLCPRDSDLYVSAFLAPTQPMADATIRGPKSVLDVVSPDKLRADMRAFIDLADCKALGPQDIRVQVWNKDNFQISYINPVTIKVFVSKRGADIPPPADK